jgi:hypothetical protein
MRPDYQARILSAHHDFAADPGFAAMAAEMGLTSELLCPARLL